MKILIKMVVLCLCVHLLSASETYRAASVSSNDISPSTYPHLIREAGKSNADILVLPSPELSGNENNYDEIVKSLSEAAKESSLYVVAHVHETVRCQKVPELVKSNLVFDREGAIVSVYRKPVNNVANCTPTDPGLETFSTDFGVTFASLMEDDMVLRHVEDLKGLKNFVVTGALPSEIPLLSGSQLMPSWAYVTKANLVSSRGIFNGKQGPKADGGQLFTADINRNRQSESKPVLPVVNPKELEQFSTEDMTQYIIRPLDVEAGVRGHRETVCHGTFCCDFDIKTSISGSKTGNYGLAVFDGIRHYSSGNHIGVQNCAIFSCAGLYKRSCDLGSEDNNTSIIFKSISISADYTQQNSIQYPIIQSTDVFPPSHLKFVSKSDSNQKVVLEVKGMQNLRTFGIFGRDFSKDFKTEFFVEGRNSTESCLTVEIYDFINSDDVQDFVDYVWIRLRVLILVVSIYILEMM